MTLEVNDVCLQGVRSLIIANDNLVNASHHLVNRLARAVNFSEIHLFAALSTQIVPALV
jgi:hypothetical protein